MPRLPNCFAVLGNHDYNASRDPFSQAAAVDDLGPATLLASALALPVGEALLRQRDDLVEPLL